MSVFHIKYRPQKFEDLDLTKVGKTLKSMIGAEERPQTFLFCGPKGSGKTSAARIVAKAVNCLNPKKGEPCDKCDNCREIREGSSLDVVEIDAASNRGIDDVRELKQKSVLWPTKLKVKVFVIDEVHMLTKEAFNALLKLIEEPPEKTLFIMCTTDPSKIPETVLSRLFRVDFYQGSRLELRSSLLKIVKGEGIELSSNAEELMLGLSDGSFRNLQKLFNEMYLRFGKKIGDKEAEDFGRLYGLEINMDDIENDLLEGRKKDLVDRLEKMAANGVDFGVLRNRWLYYFHQKWLMEISGQKGSWEVDRLSLWLSKLVEAGEWEKQVNLPQLPLQMAVVKFFCQSESKVVKVPNKITEVKQNREKTKVEEAEAGDFDLKLVVEQWPKVLVAVRPYNHSVEAFLRGARPSRFKGKKLVVEVFYDFHRQKLEEPKNRKIVEAGLKAVFGGEMAVEFETVKKEKGKESVALRVDVLPVVSQKTEADVDRDIYEVAKNIFG